MKKLFYFFVLSFISILMFNCSSGDKKDAAEKDKKSEVSEIPKPPANIPPGTISAFGTIISYKDSAVPKKAVFKIVKVLAYGSAAPSLADGIEIEVSLPDNIIKNVDNAKLSSGNECVMLLRNIEKMGSEQVSNWICVKFN